MGFSSLNSLPVMADLRTVDGSDSNEGSALSGKIAASHFPASLVSQRKAQSQDISPTR